ncbi:MAG: ABC transporter permease subunit [[Clostridium] nexile]
MFAGGAVGIVICSIPALLKVKWGANEVVSSLMLNYIVLYLGTYILRYVMLDAAQGIRPPDNLKRQRSFRLLFKRQSSYRAFSGFGTRDNGILRIYKSKWGYAIRMTGKNSMFAKYSGIGVGEIVLSQVIGGAVAGMGAQ